MLYDCVKTGIYLNKKIFYNDKKVGSPKIYSNPK